MFYSNKYRKYSNTVKYEIKKSQNEEFILECLEFLNALKENDIFSTFEEAAQNKNLISEQEKIKDALFYTQLNRKYNYKLNEIDFLNKFRFYVDWEFICSDKAIVWDLEKIKLFTGFLILGQINNEFIIAIQEFIKDFSIYGIFYSNSLTFEMLDYIDNFYSGKSEDIKNDYWYSTRSIVARNESLINQIFDERREEFYLSSYNNKNLQVEHLKIIKGIWDNTPIVITDKPTGNYGRGNFDLDNNNTTKLQRFIIMFYDWVEALKNAKIDWNIETIEYFIDLLNNENGKYSKENLDSLDYKKKAFSTKCWKMISNKVSIENLEVIQKYGEKLDLNEFFLSNSNVIYDYDILQYFNLYDFQHFDKIHITNNGLLLFKNSLNSVIKDISSSRRGDDWIEDIYFSRRFPTLINNINIIWSEELIKHLNFPSKLFSDNDTRKVDIIDFGETNRTGKLSIKAAGWIVATKTVPLTFGKGMLLYPNKDYLVTVFEAEKEPTERYGQRFAIYKGVFDLNEWELM